MMEVEHDDFDTKIMYDNSSRKFNIADDNDIIKGLKPLKKGLGSIRRTVTQKPHNTNNTMNINSNSFETISSSSFLGQ